MRRKRGPKKVKTHLIFDEKEREEFLTGFQKRNLQRKLKKKEQLDQMLKEEKKKIKRNQKQALEDAIKSQRTVPEVAHLLEPVTYDLPDHTVTVETIDNMDTATAPATISGGGNSKDDVEKLRKLIKDLKNKRVQNLKSGALHQQANQMQRKKDRSKARQVKKLMNKSMKHAKKKTKKKHGK